MPLSRRNLSDNRTKSECLVTLGSIDGSVMFVSSALLASAARLNGEHSFAILL